MSGFELYVSENNLTAAKISEAQVNSLVYAIRNTISSSGCIWIAGNGGSASTASHAACDLSKGVSLKNGYPVRAISLMDQIATLTAWSNDFGFDEAISNMCKQTLQKEDLLIVISASGNSNNVVKAVMTAREMGIKTASLTGFDGGIVKDLTAMNVNIPSQDMQIIENMHLMIVHWLFKSI